MAEWREEGRPCSKTYSIVSPGPCSQSVCLAWSLRIFPEWLALPAVNVVYGYSHAEATGNQLDSGRLRPMDSGCSEVFKGPDNQLVWAGLRLGMPKLYRQREGARRFNQSSNRATNPGLALPPL